MVVGVGLLLEFAVAAFLSALALRIPPLRAELATQLFGVADRITVAVVIEIGPHATCAACPDPAFPYGQFIGRVIMPIPMLRAVKAHVDFVGGFHQLVWQARPAAGAKNDAAFSKRGEYLFVPPGRVPELDDVPASRIELLHDPLQPRCGVSKAWWQLEKKASHPTPKYVAICPKSRTSVFVPVKRFTCVISSHTFTV